MSEELSRLPFTPRAVIVNGPPPLRYAEVPITTGLVAVYGRNGVGKTRLLHSIGDVMSGSQSNSMVIVDLTDEELIESLMQQALDEWLEGDERSDLSGRTSQFAWRSSSRSRLERALGDIVLERWMRIQMWDGFGSATEGRPRPGLVVDELVRNAVWVLEPISKDRWSLGVAVRLTNETPLLSSLRQRLAHEWQIARSEMPSSQECAEATEEEKTEFDERKFDVAWRFGQRMSRWDFFTALWQEAFTPEDFDEYSWIVSELMQHGRLIPIVKIVPVVVSGPLCGVDSRLIDLSNLSCQTLTSLRRWSYFEHVSSAQELTSSGIMTEESFFEEGLSLLEAAGTEVRVAPWIENQLEILVLTVNGLLAEMLAEAPVLRCQITDPDRWVDHEPFVWTARDPTGVKVELKNLSTAQVHLVRLAFSVAFSSHRHPADEKGSERNGESHMLLLLDEPEAGLHRVAEDRLCQALHNHAVHNGMTIIATTHAASFLRHPEVKLIEVFRGSDGWTSTRPAEFPENFDENELGISRADLLQLYELVLLVEGHHEQLVFGELLGAELRRRRVLQLPMRGMYNLSSVVDLEILAGTLEQPVLAVLDNTRSEAIDTLWGQLRQRELGAGLEGIDRIVDECLGPNSERTDEERQILSLAKNLIRTHQLDRFEVYGMSRADIIEYLPPERLVPGATSWAELRQEHARLREHAPKRTVKDFKRWLSKEHRADFGDDAIRLAAATLADSPPADFLMLLARIDSIIGGWTR